MKIVLQRVLRSTVIVEAKVVSSIEKGILILLGIKEADALGNVDSMVEDVLSMRLFEGEEGHLSKSITEVQGEILVVSQFTLYGKKTEEGWDFSNAAKHKKAKALYTYFIDKLKVATNRRILMGEFGSYMEVSLVNDGPVTIIHET